MTYFILVKRSTRIIDAIAVCTSYFEKTVGYQFVSEAEAAQAKEPYDLYRVPFSRVYRHNVDVGHKLGHAIPGKAQQLPIGYALWPEDEAA
jgi:hypothetical protein